jgi:hypothetical protein
MGESCSILMPCTWRDEQKENREEEGGVLAVVCSSRETGVVKEHYCWW